MAFEGHNELFPTLEAILRDSPEPLDCHQLFELPAVRALAASPNRVSDYLGVMFRRGQVSRVAAARDSGSKARWAYFWRAKEQPAWKRKDIEVIDYKPKAILDRPSIYITEDGDNITIELPNLSILIKKK